MWLPAECLLDRLKAHIEAVARGMDRRRHVLHAKVAQLVGAEIIDRHVAHQALDDDVGGGRELALRARIGAADREALDAGIAQHHGIADIVHQQATGQRHAALQRRPQQRRRDRHIGGQCQPVVIAQ